MNKEDIYALVILLNQDDKIMNSFIDDPIGFIKERGYTITPEQENKLNSYIQDVQKSDAMQSMIKKCVLKAALKNVNIPTPNDVSMGSGRDCSYHLCG